MNVPFVCPVCSAESWNPTDAEQRYCGRCHRFVDDPPPPPAQGGPAPGGWGADRQRHDELATQLPRPRDG